MARRRWIDEPVRRVVRHLEAVARTGEPGRPSRPDPVVEAAIGLCHDSSPGRRLAVEALALGGLTDREIGDRQELDVEVVSLYLAMFHDVRPLLTHSDAILFRAIGSSLHDGTGLDRSQALKLLCLAGGPRVADALVSRPGCPTHLSSEDGFDWGDPFLADLFDQFVLAHSIGAGGRSSLVAIRLGHHAAEKAREREPTLASSVLGPVVLPDFEIAREIEARVTGCSEAWIARDSYRPVRAGCAPASTELRDQRDSGPGLANGFDEGGALRGVG